MKSASPPPRRRLRPPPRIALALALVWFVGACVDEPLDPAASVALRPILRADTDSGHLLRPTGVAVGDDHIVVVEEGRRTLTWLDREGRIRARRPLYLPDIDGAAREGGSVEAGAVLLRDPTGYWTLLPGLGPVHVPLDPEGTPSLLGAGPTGEPPVPGVDTASADLSGVVGMTLSRGELILAVDNRILRDSEGRLLVEAGTGERGVPAIGVAEEQPLGLGSLVGMAADGEGAFYFSDAGSGRIWRVGRTGSLRPLAGGGDTLRPPSEPTLAYDIALELDRSALAWDDQAREVVALLGSTVYRFDPTAEGGPSAIAFGAGTSLARSIAVDGDGVVVTSLRGSITRTTPDSVERLFDSPQGGTPPLAWAGALSPVGTSSLLIQDVGQRRLLVDIPGEGTFTVAAPLIPSAPLVHPFAGTEDGRLYSIRTSGLTDLDFIDFSVRTVAPRRGSFAVDGQPLADVTLPDQASLAMDAAGRLWLLDPGAGLLVRAEPLRGELTRIAGSLSGGSRPSAERAVSLDGLDLSSARSLQVQGDLAVVLEDSNDGGTRVYALNTGELSVELAGVTIDPGTAAYLGGDGDSAYTVGASLLDTNLARIVVALPAASTVFLSASDPAAPGVLGAAADGILADVGIDGPAPDALARTDEGALVAGWRDGSELIGANPTATPVSVLGVTLAPGARQLVGEAPRGAVFLTADSGDVLYSLSEEGVISSHTRSATAALATAPAGTEELALFRGGILALGSGSLLGMAAEEGTPSFAGLDLPPAPGAVLVAARGRYDGALRLGNLDFGANVVGMAAAAGSALTWADGEARAIFRTAQRGTQPLAADTPVERIFDGGVSPGADQPTAMALDGEDVYFGHAGGLWLLRDGTVDRLGQDTGVTGVAAYGRGAVARTSAGLSYYDGRGELLDSISLLGAPSLDPTLSALGQSLSTRGGQLVLVVGGEVFALEGWPARP